MYSLSTSVFRLHDGMIFYGETREEVIAKAFQYLEAHHKDYIGQPTMQRLTELQALMDSHIIEVPES